MDYLLEENNISVAHDTVLPGGHFVKAGSKITIVSSQGEYNGYKMRVPPPEFEALMLFNALDAAFKAMQMKKVILTQRSSFDEIIEIDTSEENMQKFFAMCQQAMAAITFSISAIESWVNKSFILHGKYDGKPIQLLLEVPNKKPREVSSDKIASDRYIPIRSKLFQLAPQIFDVPPLKEHSSLKIAVSELVEERNIVMHMQSSLTINSLELDRVSYAVKLYKVSAFHGPKQILNYLNYIYEKSALPTPLWLNVANRKLKAYHKKLK
ncbi:hypothetical protein [Vibrio sagamiensis]|uniref:Uncharacterized protein n=1 Tax=Vibrio sagamiensis NBRC 104589 TaxID=1219064 RepID=A0A511QL17_9VIBR|nr:hypothetical protein [Vibrio sagamiensis]PNQ69004.1 hypothetical protein C1141_06350 [Vibrio agarivorans]GEM77172.1 hypothetical protein VSA01S_32840 [Vibrio sagamiensis NBRC 104589]